MGKSASSKAEVTEYRMSIQLGVALKLDSISKILVDEKVAWAGTISSNTTLNINKPDLFGGERKEGGLIGSIEVYMGADDQVASTQLAGRYGRTPSTCPGFRGYTSLFFRGNGQVTTGASNIFTQMTADWPGVGGNGFVWKHNTPLIAQKVEVEGTCKPKTTLNQAYALIPNPDVPNYPDANPAHLIWEIATGPDFDLQIPESEMDRAAFEAASELHFNEAMGMTILLTKQMTGKALIDEILQHVQGTCYTDPETGKFTYKPHRFDYDVETLPVLSPENAKMVSWQVRGGSDIVNQITVSWTNPVTEKDETITGHVVASIDALDGQALSNTRNYYGFRHASIARKALARDLTESTAPLVSCELEVDRTAWNFKPGSVIQLHWPRRTATDRIMRVGKINYGKPGAAKIRISLTEDVFSLALPPIVIDPGTGWVDPSAEPSPLTMQLTTLPSYFTRNGALQSTAVEIERPEVLVMALADSQDDDSLDYDLVAEGPDASGNDVVQTRGTMTMTPLSYLTATMNAAATGELPAALFPDINWGPTIGGFVWIGYGDENQEIALVTGRSETGWTISRGALDTIPRTWGSGTPVWCVGPGARIVDTFGPQAGGADVTYRGLDRTSLGRLAYADAPDETATLTERPWLPLRPANVAVNGTAFGSLNVSGASTIEITWATRNRLLEDSQPLAWTDGSVAPEYRQETIVRFYNVATGALVAEYPWLWLDTSISFPKTAFDRWASVRVEVTSRRDDLEALQAHSVTLTGLANNPAAPLPPAPAARTTPPPVFPAPAVDAFAAVAGTDEALDGSSVPTIIVSGTQDDLDADHLVIRTKKTGTTVWRDHPSVPLNGEAVSVEITGVQPTTQYDIEAAYLFGGQPSVYRTLDDVTTGSIVSGETVPVVPGNISGTPTLSIASSLGSDGTVRVLAAGDWNDATNAITYVVELDDGVAVRTLEFAESKFSEIPAIVGRTYRYRAKGKSGTGHLSAAWSNWSASVEAGGDTTAPGAPTAGSAVARGLRNLVTWTPATAADYRGLILWRTTTSTPPTYATTPYAPIIQGSNFIDDAVTPGQQYWYWGASVDYSGNRSAITAIGNCTARFVNVGGGDISGTDNMLVTSLGTAALVFGQGTGATSNTLAQMNATEGANLTTVTTGDGVALPMYLSGADTATFVGNRYTRTAGSATFNQLALSRQAINGPAQVSGRLLTGFTALGFTTASAIIGSNAQTTMGPHWYRTSTTYICYSGSTVLLNCGTALNGVTFGPETVLAVTDDGITQSWWADGVLMHSRPTPSGSTVRRLGAYAYSSGNAVGSLNLEPYNNAQWSVISGIGRPDDNASRADNLVINWDFQRGFENWQLSNAGIYTLDGRWATYAGTTGNAALYANQPAGASLTTPNDMWARCPVGGTLFATIERRTTAARRLVVYAQFYSEAGVADPAGLRALIDVTTNTSDAIVRDKGSVAVPAGYPIARLSVNTFSAANGVTKFSKLRVGLTEEAANVTETRTAALVFGQGPYVTYNGSLTPTVAENRTQRLDSAGKFDNIANVLVRPLVSLTDRTADVINYTGSGTPTVQSLRPQEANANVTETRTAALVFGQTAWVTEGTLTPTIVTNRTQRLDSAGKFDDIANILSRPLVSLTDRTADVINYTGSGTPTVQSLQPQEAGANATEGRTAALVSGQSAWATYATHTPAQIANRTQYLDSTTGQLDSLSRVTTRSLSLLTGRTADQLNFVGGGGVTVESLRPQEAGANVTESRTAALVSGQTGWATYATLTPAQMATRTQYLSTTTGELDSLTRVTSRNLSLLTGRTADQINYTGSGTPTVQSLQPQEAGANATEGRTAALVSGQSAWATYATHTPAQIAPRVALGLADDGRLVLPTLSDGSQIKNNLITINANGTLSGAGSGAVTPAGLGVPTTADVVATFEDFQADLEEGLIIPQVSGGLTAAATKALASGGTAPVAVQWFTVQAAHGEFVAFPREYDQAPDVLLSLSNILPTPTRAGEYLNVTPSTLSGTGLTGRALMVYPGTSPVYAGQLDDDTSGRTVDTVIGAWAEFQKATDTVAFNGQYTATVQVRLDGEPDPETPTQSTAGVPMTLGLYGRRTSASPWVKFGEATYYSLTGSLNVLRDVTITGTSPPEWTTWNAHSASEYRVQIEVGGETTYRRISNIIKVEYTYLDTPGTGAESNPALPSGQKISYIIFPRG